MELIPEAKRRIDEIKNTFVKIPIFTWRPWKIKNFNIKKETKKWLKNSKLIYNKIFFEKGIIIYLLVQIT